MAFIVDAAQEPVVSRFDYWRQHVCESIVRLELDSYADQRFEAALRVLDVGPAGILQLRAPESHVRRGDRLVRRAEADYYKVDIVTRGRLIAEQDGRQCVVEAGDFTLIDFSRPGKWVFPDPSHALTALLIPRSFLPFSPDEVARLLATTLPGRVGTGAVICSMVHELARHGDEVGTADGVRILATVMDLLTGVLARRLDPTPAIAGTIRNTLIATIYAHIETHLGDPGLSPATIAAVHHISVRQVQKLFQAQGHSVAAWIRERRLERCRADLLDPRLARHSIKMIGARWGFLDPGHFNKTFRARFGVPPGHYRREYPPKKTNVRV